MPRTLTWVGVMRLSPSITFLLCVLCDFSLFINTGKGSALSTTSSAKRLLVLGGTGFVGNEIIRQAQLNDFEVVSVSRRGRLYDEETDQTSNSRVVWVKGDAGDPTNLQRIVNENGPFDACVHTIGLLLDNESGFSEFNKLVSGSGSEPGPESTYDRYFDYYYFDTFHP